MVIIHELCDNSVLFDEKTIRLCVYDWTSREWEDKLSCEGHSLNKVGEIEYDYKGDGEYVEIWRKSNVNQNQILQ